MYISIDLGRSTTRIASSIDLKNILKIVKFPTESRIENQKKNFIEALEAVSVDGEVEAIAFGFPGISGKMKDSFLKSANYPQIEGMDISLFFPDKFKDAKILVENDATLGALGEAYFGSGKDKKVVAYLTLSTGLGGSRVVKYENEYDVINAEPGHHIIDKNDQLVDGSGFKGTFESFCAGSYFRKRYGRSPDSSAGDQIWKEYAQNLSIGLLNVISMWDPEIIVLGGGLAIHNFDIFHPFLIYELKSQIFFNVPEIVKSTMEDDSGIYGGFILLKENL
ncbi:ROK family protein [Patescibacteria group bacterium]|nr:ROK family protein [Patescibacteria group bacterium]